MNTPKISIIVIVYDMPRQAMITLQSLTTAYQQGVSTDDYEVIVVENRSTRMLDAEQVCGLQPNFRYFLRDEPGKSPAAALNFGFALATAPTIGIMIDGARLVTPGVLRFALMAVKITPQALVAVPGYEIGNYPQSLDPSQTEAKDIALLAKIKWPHDGYRLFEIASISLANRSGFFTPFMECNCLFAPADVLKELGGADERFDLPGGGALNLYMYHQLAHHPRTTFFVLAGEGSFHQVHGGVTTTVRDTNPALLSDILSQLNSFLGEPFKSPTLPSIVLGTLNVPLHPFLRYSAEVFTPRQWRDRKFIAKFPAAPPDT